MTGYCNRQVQVQRDRRLEHGLRELKEMDNRPQLASAIGFVFLHFRSTQYKDAAFKYLGFSWRRGFRILMGWDGSRVTSNPIISVQGEAEF